MSAAPIVVCYTELCNMSNILCPIFILNTVLGRNVINAKYYGLIPYFLFVWSEINETYTKTEKKLKNTKKYDSLRSVLRRN